MNSISVYLSYPLQNLIRLDLTLAFSIMFADVPYNGPGISLWRIRYIGVLFHIFYPV